MGISDLAKESKKVQQKKLSASVSITAFEMFEEMCNGFKKHSRGEVLEAAIEYAYKIYKRISRVGEGQRRHSRRLGQRA
ncbi:hypothetical protein [Hydrogenimonas cancrithermarum]|uniref:Uncharacterized protein n=1 Tax=Hydrogenimonas cancrithermarum TaxID=2993563 RepID=A0ABN6WYP8_9BACT|nr:hypothetical protein [Hydrogenimonas cancrithermarum]BDY13981.1 hypothetical protein HCR_22940 [Hydrogenimonas cancrithermarum]